MTKDLKALNKRVAKKMGIYWCDNPELCIRKTARCLNPYIKCKDCFLSASAGIPNPDFIAHPEQLLREMAKREDYIDFVYQIGKYDYIWKFGYIIDTYILDTTEGKLAKAVDEFIKEETK